MQIPFISTVARRFRVYEPIMTIEIWHDGRKLVVDQMKEQMGEISDKIKGKRYSVGSNTVDLVVKRRLTPGTYRVQLLDPMASTSVELKREKPLPEPVKEGDQNTEAEPVEAIIRRDASCFLAQANAELAGRAVDSQFMQQTFGQVWGMRQKIIFFFVAAFVGWLVGAAF